MTESATRGERSEYNGLVEMGEIDRLVA
jgi:hypothetical protein